MPQFSPDFDVISKKKRSSIFHILISQCHFDGASEAYGPSAGPPEANGLHDGPPEVHGPRGHCPPLSEAMIVAIKYRTSPFAVVNKLYRNVL